MATKTAGSAKSEKPLKTRDSGTLGAAGILLFAFGSCARATKDARLREWCLGSMEAENNAVFIKNVADWLGGGIIFF